MSEQQSYEAFIIRTYERNYSDFENNFHIDVHRRILFVKDLDATHREYLKDIKTCKDIIKDPNTDEINREQANLRLNAALEASQDLEQQKREITEYLNTLIRHRKTSLEFDYNRVALYFQEKKRNLESRAKDKETSCQQTSCQATSSQQTSFQQTQQHSAPPTPPPERTTEIEKSGGKRSKRARRSRATAGAATRPKKGNAKKKRVGKAGRAAAAQRAVIPLEDTVAIDPNEPIYCVCEQIEFGKMIMCDNDLCPIAWFHFSCVSVTTAPKGKWYCPKCRGTRPNVLKRRRLLLQELEKYNQEMEEKASLSLNKE